jgi:16S rRNA (cytosine1402-N4)-methyltransferase
MEGLDINPSGVYVDVTFGGGGHSREILKLLGEDGSLFGFDQDADAENNIPNDDRFTFVRSNFRYLNNFMRYYGEAGNVDGVLADLGVSSHHFDDKDRGFSFRFEGTLDMRMNQRSGQTAADILNNYPEEKLADIFYLYGEIKTSRRLAALICKAREKRTIQDISEFLEIIQPMVGKDKEKKFLAQVFQALRIEVNDEMQALRQMLKETLKVLKPGGRLVVMTYHSLEDRLVKNFLKMGNFEGKAEKDFYGNIYTPFRIINNKVIVPTEEEIELNPRSRSAKLRVAEKIENDGE